MAAAFDRNDLSALRAATIRLELASPDRVIKVGEESGDEEPTPQQVREQANHLIHSLDTAEPKESTGTGVQRLAQRSR